MAEIIFNWLALASGAITTSVICVALLRQPIRGWLGAEAAVRLWWIVPIGVSSLLLPKATAVALVASQTTISVVASEVVQPALLARTLDWRECAIWVWLAGCVVLVIRAAIQQRRYSSRISWFVRRQGTSPAGDEPSVVGIMFPRIVLPADFRLRYSSEERKLVLLHEYAHIARFDGLINLAVHFVLYIQWFNPIAHWAAGAIGRDQELACDAIVARRHPRKLKTYADAMLKATVGRPLPVPLASLWNAYHPTVERIAMLNKHQKHRSSTKLGLLALILGGGLASALVYAARPATATHKVVEMAHAAVSSSEPLLTQPAPKEIPSPVSNKVAAGPQASQSAAQPKAIAYVPDSAPEKAMDVTTERQNYLMAFSLTLAKNDGASPPRITTTRTESSLVVKDSGRVVLEIPGDTRIAMVAKQRDDRILFETVIESIADQKEIARPTILVLPGQKGAIRIGESNERGLIDGVEINVTITPITAEEADELRSKPRRTSPKGGLCSPGTPVSRIQSTLIGLMPPGMTAKSVGATNGGFRLSGGAQSQAQVESFVRSVAQVGDFEVQNISPWGLAKTDVEGSSGDSSTKEFEMNFLLKCNG